ncbi:MAG TPA: DUF4377 domain-containing protein [Longimicrobiaceae bacterium]
MRRFRPLLLVLFLLAAPVLAACSVVGGSDERFVTLVVGPEKVSCQGFAVQDCLLVREPPAEEWTLFYDDIEGFEWQAGYEWTLVVAVRDIDNPPADGSSQSYRLVKVVKKTYITPLPG